MARDFSARTDIDNTDLVNFPDGRLLNSNPPAARNGTAVVEEVYGDAIQLFLKLLRDASINPSGNADTDGTSQYLDALVAKIVEVIRDTAATVSLRGAVELATLIETQDGINTTNAVTPATLNGRSATTARTGILELATQTETNTGTDSSRAVTPSTLAGRTATETRTGLAEIATQTEVNTGTDDSRYITPLKLNSTLSQTTQVVINDNSTIIRTKTVNIPSWNMQTTSVLDIPHGVTLANVISVTGTIRNDTGNIRYTVGQSANTGAGQPDLFVFRVDSVNVRLQRNSTGQFNDASFSSTAFNRGILQITYS